MKKGAPILLAAFLVFILLSDLIISIDGATRLCKVRCQKCRGKCKHQTCSEQCQLETHHDGKCRGLFTKKCYCYSTCGGGGGGGGPPPCDDPPCDDD